MKTVLTVLKCALLHVGLLVCRETQETEGAVLEGGHFVLRPKLLLSRMEEASDTWETECYRQTPS